MEPIGAKKKTQDSAELASPLAQAQPPEDCYCRGDPWKLTETRPGGDLEREGTDYVEATGTGWAAVVHWVPDTDEPPSWQEAHRRV